MFTTESKAPVSFAARVARSRLSLVVFAILCLTPGVPARAEDPAAPDISIGPDGGTYSIAASSRAEASMAGGVVVDVSLVFTDSDGMNKDSLSVSVTSPGELVPVTRTEWTSNDPILARAKYRFTLYDRGDHILNVTIGDKTGRTATRQATFTLVYTDTALPIVSLDPHHNEYRNTNAGAATLAYATPSYTSLGAERSLGIRYDSEQADPTAFVQLDAQISMSRVDYYRGGTYSLTIVDTATNQPVGPATFWTLDGWSRQRLAAQWSMRGRPTGAYMYRADVRAHRSDGTSALTSVPIRILVVNHAVSRYGSGWNIAGMQRIHSVDPLTDNGFLLEEGDGVARWFEKEGCATDVCSYRTPKGDFSRIVYNRTANQWIRTDTDGSVATFSGRTQPRTAAWEGLLLNSSDRFGRTTNYYWQASGDGQNIPLLSWVKDPAGKITTLGYSAGNYLKNIVEPAGRRVEFAYTNSDLTSCAGALGAMNLVATYDANHKLTSYTNARGTWDVGWDERVSKVKSITAPAVAVPGNVASRAMTKYTSLPGVAVPEATACAATCPKPALAANQVFLTITDPGEHKTNITVDRYGHTLRITDEVGTTLTFGRTEDGLVSQTETPLQTTSTAWTASGQRLSEEVNGTVTFHGSLLTGARYDYMNHQGEARWYVFGDRGELLKTWLGKREEADKKATTYTYDSLYRPTSMSGPNGERTQWSYDPVTQNVSEVRWLSANGTWQKQTFVYDGAGRAQSTTNPLNETVTMTYDEMNRPLTARTGDRLTTYKYTGLDLTSVIVPGPLEYKYQYNALGWLERETFPDGKFRSTEYNIDGLVVRNYDRRGSTVAMVYDKGHRVTERHADDRAMTIAYPPIPVPGAEIVMQNNEVTESLGYGNIGDIAKTTYKTSLRKYVVEAVLDPNNAWERVGTDVHRYSGTTLQRTDYVRYQRERNLIDPSLLSAFHIDQYYPDFSVKRTTLTFDNSGRHVKTTFPNGVTQQNTFNIEGVRTATTFSPVRGLDATYEYDVMGRLKSRTASGDSIKIYHYDSYGRLQYHQKALWSPSAATWVFGYDEQFTYDVAGNRTNRGGTVVANSNAYTTYDGYTLEYDLEGNLTRKYKAGFDQRFEWNALGQLASVTTNGATVTYGYTPSGLRFRRTENGSSRYYMYADGDLLLELDNNQNPVRRYVHLPGVDKPLSVTETVAGTERTSYFTIDHPGHVSGVMDSAGVLKAAYDYQPFGNEKAAYDGQPLRFMGRELDFSTGLYYVRTRWYDPSLGRFASEDPIGLAGGLNTYGYVENDPINRRDPSGLSPCPPWRISCRENDENNPLNLGPLSSLNFWEEPGFTFLMHSQLEGFRAQVDARSNAQCRPHPLNPRGCAPSFGEEPFDSRIEALAKRRQEAAREREARRHARWRCRTGQAAPPERGMVENFMTNVGWNAVGMVLGFLVPETLGAQITTGVGVSAAVETLGSEVLMTPCGPGLF